VNLGVKVTNIARVVKNWRDAEMMSEFGFTLVKLGLVQCFDVEWIEKDDYCECGTCEGAWGWEIYVYVCGVDDVGHIDECFPV